MFIEAFLSSGSAVLQIFILGGIGYLLTRKQVLGDSAVEMLSRLVVEVTLPALIFSQLVKSFRFDLYPDWWFFPLLGAFIILAGLAVGYALAFFIKGSQHKMQFVSLVAFQNSGYLPLALISAILTGQKADTMLVMLFLYLLGFNLLVWSAGAYMLSSHANKRFELGSVFSPPVIAIILGLITVALGASAKLPALLLKPVHMVGECTLPLALFVVGGNLAAVRFRKPDLKAMSLLVLAKLIILPAVGLWLVLKMGLPELLGLLIVMELAVPSATSLSVIVRHYKKEDLLISQGVFLTHLLSLVTLPVFLSLYLMRVMIQ